MDRSRNSLLYSSTNTEFKKGKRDLCRVLTRSSGGTTPYMEESRVVDRYQSCYDCLEMPLLKVNPHRETQFEYNVEYNEKLRHTIEVKYDERSTHSSVVASFDLSLAKSPIYERKKAKPETVDLHAAKPTSIEFEQDTLDSDSSDSGIIADDDSCSSATHSYQLRKLKKRKTVELYELPLESDSDSQESITKDVEFEQDPLDSESSTKNDSGLTADDNCSSPKCSWTDKQIKRIKRLPKHSSVSPQLLKPLSKQQKKRKTMTFSDFEKSTYTISPYGFTTVQPSSGAELVSDPSSKLINAAKKVFEEHGKDGWLSLLNESIRKIAEMYQISYKRAAELCDFDRKIHKEVCQILQPRHSLKRRWTSRPMSRNANGKVSKKSTKSANRLVRVAHDDGGANTELVYCGKPISLTHYATPKSSLVGLHSRNSDSKFYSVEDIRCPPVDTVSSQPEKQVQSLNRKLDATSSGRKQLTTVFADSAEHVKTETHQKPLAVSLRETFATVGGEAKMPMMTSSLIVWNEKLKSCSDLLHAHDYSRIVQTFSRPPDEEDLPPDIQVPLIFIYGLALLKLGKLSDAKNRFIKCEEKANEIERKSDVALCCVYLGDLELSNQNYHEAAGYYRRAIQDHSVDSIASQFKMVPPSRSSLNSKLGSCLRNSSKPVEAIHAYKCAVSDAKTDKDKLSSCTSLGNLYQSLGENQQALEQYEHSIELAKKLKDNVSLGWAHGNMGNAYLGLYQKEKALHHLKQSLDLTVQYEPVPQAIGRAYNNLGTAFQSLGDLDEAEEQYDLALSQAIYGNDIPGQARVYGNIGNVYMLRKDYERAVPHYTEVLRLSRDRSTITTAYHNRGCAYYEWGEHKKAKLYGTPFTEETPPAATSEKKPSNSNDFPVRGGLPDPISKPHQDSKKELECKYYLHGPEFEYEETHRPHVLIDSVAKFFKHGSGDLDEVIKQNETSFENIKGSSKGFSLSVSLFESNSRTFHRKQDCLVNIGEWKNALVIAEQSRARTLGELMLKRKGLTINHPLTSPLDLSQIKFIVGRQDCPVVYLSYTGARLLCWVLLPYQDEVKMNMFEVPLKDDQFDGKSFDYHLRYNLTEALVERSFEMYRSFLYDEDQVGPVQDLYKLVATPLLAILEEFGYKSTSSPKRILLIPDSYTMLLPFTCLLAPKDKSFFGDTYYFQIVPSLLTMGILSQLPDVVVRLPADSQSMCVVGNPSIPPFSYNGEEWNLGKLPHAAREAKWVGYTLKTTPILDEQATKNAVLMRIMNAKVIHIATHGSAAAGFLAFAGLTSSQRNKDIVDSRAVLLYPEEVEKLTISPALVVLSSCDSGRGTVKADGIQGMARAFILAGAQAVLTTLWRVPDESAAVFMKLFYQFLIEGFPSSESLQKAILTLRCFSKYSQYIHWSGFQITGRDIHFEIAESTAKPILNERLGLSSVFPRLEEVQDFETALVASPCLPTDVQVLRASPGIKPSEIVIDFLHSNHDSFKGGIFWINGRRPELIEASILYIEQAMDGNLANLMLSEVRQAALVLDAIETLPSSESLMQLMRNRFVHIVVVHKSCNGPDQLVRDVDKQLLRGCKITEVKPLSPIHSTQRIVYSVLRKYHLAPNDKDQEVFEKLSEFTSGSPAIIETATQVLLARIKATPDDIHEALQEFKIAINLNSFKPVKAHSPSESRKQTSPASTRVISNNVTRNIPSVAATSDGLEDVWETNTSYDSWDSIAELINACNLSREEQLLLYCSSMFSCSPIPMVVIDELSSMIAGAANKKHLAGSLHCKLLDMRLMKLYPRPVVLHKNVPHRLGSEVEFVYIPQYISRALWGGGLMTKQEKIIALAIAYKTLHSLQPSFESPSSYMSHFFLGMCSLLVDMFDLNFDLVGRECYQHAYRLYVVQYENINITQL